MGEDGRGTEFRDDPWSFFRPSRRPVPYCPFASPVWYLGTARRLIDALEGGQNGSTGSQFTHRPTDLDSWATQCRMVQERFPESALSQFPSDFKKAYKQVPAEPSLAGFAVMVQWHPRKRCPAFLVGRTQFLVESLDQ